MITNQFFIYIDPEIKHRSHLEKLSKTQLLALLLEQEIAQRATPEEMYTAFGHRLGYLDKESFYKAAIKC